MKLSDKQKGIISVLFSTLFFAGMSCCVRLSGSLPTAEKALFRNFFAGIVVILIFLKEKPDMDFNKKGLAFLLLRAIAGTLGMLCNFYAIDHINLSDANMLNKMSPFFALIFSYFLLKEKLNFRQILLLIVSFIGSLLIIKPTGSNAELSSYLIAGFGGMMAGLAFTSVRIATSNGVPKSFIVLVFSVSSCLFSLPRPLQILSCPAPPNGSALSAAASAGQADSSA